MKLPLWGKVLILAAVNAALLGGASVWLLRRMLAQEFGSILLGSARERIVAVSRQISTELATTAVGDRDAMMARYSRRYGVSFYLFSNSGRESAGPPITLPEEVEQRVREGPRGVPGMRIGPLMVAPPTMPPFLVLAEPGYWIGSRLAIRYPDGAPVELGTLLLASPSLITHPFLFDLKPWVGFFGVVLTVTLMCWLPFVGSMTRSIQRMMRATAQIAAGRFATKAEVRRSDELGRLGESINRMAGQLEEHVHGQKRFLRDAAHELRSPLSRMQAALGILERQTGPESERVLGDLREEIELMSELTGELLTLARTEHPVAWVRLSPVSLAATAARAVSMENAGGTADVRMEVDPELRVTANEDRLFRGISNLVRNAIRYAGEAGPITVAAARRGGSAVLTVMDQGPGIPEEAIDKVFTPFYRVDPSRDRNTGGTGLGMAIARACVETCNGTIQCRNGSPGLVVTITLPLAASAVE